MRIYTLGTGHGDSTVSRYNSSTLYETAEGTLYFVDCGAPAEASMRRKGLLISNLRAAFITHMHDDHAGGLSAVLKQIIKYPKGRTIPFSLYLPEERAIGALQGWMTALHEKATLHDPISYHTVTDGEIYRDEELVVTAIRTRHLRTISRTEGDPCSFAYVLEFRKEGISVLHTGDLASDFSDFPAIAKTRRFDVCLCEATHYNPEQAQHTLLRSQFGRLIFNHVHDPWHVRISFGWEVDNGEKRLLAHCKDLPYPVVVAHDGDEFLI